MSAPHNVEPAQTRRFLTTFAGSENFTFQTFSDRPELRRVLPGGKSYDPQARWQHGTFDALALYLMHLNAGGAGVYVMVNTGDGKGRTARNVVKVRALFIDTDGAAFPVHLPLKPHAVVESSPGRYHLYWRVNGISLGDFGICQQALAEHYGTDPAVKDLPRVMRLPGFYHHKAEPVMVQLLEAHDHKLYTAAEVYARWPFLAQRLTEVRAAAADQKRKRAGIVRLAAEHSANLSAATGHGARARKLLYAHHDTVARAGIGTRNTTLCRAAYTLGGYVAGGYLEPQNVEEVLLAAAIISGLSESEARGLIPRALRKSMDAPLELTASTPTDHKPRSRQSRVYARMRGWCHGRA
jgi:hypothetical protein